ncbi:MAG: hypothetical protein ABL973_09225 [Micropepsaceae bacterium]
MFGGASIATSAALFPLDDYKGKIVADLFGDDAYFGDGEAFWALQNTAIAALRDAYLASGWREVAILEPGQRFREWEYEKVSKKKGGHVFVTVSERGEVETFEGYLPAKRARQVHAVDGVGDDEDVVAATRPEVSAALQNYIDLHRHAAVRQALMSVPDVALRLMIATALCGSPLWQVRAEPQTAKTKAIGESLATSPAQEAFLKRRAEIVALLGLDEEGTALVQDGREGAAAQVFATLLKLPNAEVMRVAAVLAADTLAAGGALVEAVGAQLKVDVAASWQADDAFFDLVREKSVVNAMLAEVASRDIADANVAVKLKTQKQIVRDCLNGANGRARAAAWLPGWLAFPPRGYTSRGGLSHVAAWTAVAGLFPQA